MNERQYFKKIKPEQFFLNSYEISHVIISEVIIISIKNCICSLWHNAKGALKEAFQSSKPEFIRLSLLILHQEP